MIWFLSLGVGQSTARLGPLPHIILATADWFLALGAVYSACRFQLVEEMGDSCNDPQRSNDPFSSCRLGTGLKGSQKRFCMQRKQRRRRLGERSDSVIRRQRGCVDVCARRRVR